MHGFADSFILSLAFCAPRGLVRAGALLAPFGNRAARSRFALCVSFQLGHTLVMGASLEGKLLLLRHLVLEVKLPVIAVEKVGCHSACYS